MGKIIKFPTGEELKLSDIKKKKKPETAEELGARVSNECVEVSHFLFELMEEFIVTGQASQWETLMEMQLRNNQYRESRDFFVVVNLLNALLLRFYGIPHDLQKDLDRLFVKIKDMEKRHIEAVTDPNEIIFKPDFELPELPEEPDDTD
tara:strand:- start:6084 stop:6530 length:447 start_codon:yes stop_codon:yes gene_type:complete